MNEECRTCGFAGGKAGDVCVIPSDTGIKDLLQEIMSDRFMREHTNFETFRHFRYSSAVILDWDAETWIYSERLLDNFVRESTEFSGWEEMVKKAADECYRRQEERGEES